MQPNKIASFLAQRWARLLPVRNGTLAREHGQAMLRVIVSVVVTFYLLNSHGSIASIVNLPAWAVFAFTYVTCAVLLSWMIGRSTTAPAWRRYLGNVADVSAITYLMIASDTAGMPLFLLYLWITLGNGFRFGSRALLVSATLSLVGFGIVVSVSEAWQTHAVFATSAMLSLLILPMYTAHLITLLNNAVQRAEDASAAKSQFLARMSHELRTPLNGIVGAADIIEGGRRISPEERSLLQVIRESVEVSLRQIDNVLDFAKLEAGKLVLEKTDFDLHAVINSAVNIVRPRAVQKGLHCVVQISPNAPFRLIGDSHHLRDICLNLLSNAVKFTDQGQISIVVSAKHETDTATRLRFEVRDSGIGIHADAIAHIFDSFTQEDSSTTRRYGGTGLGTSIAKQLVELMDGHIGVTSIKGQGSVFWFELPFGKQASELVLRLPTARTLLLAQDETINAHYGKALAALDANLVHVSSADEAISALARAIRLDNPIHALLIEPSAIRQEAAREDLYDKAISAKVAIIAVGDGAEASPRSLYSADLDRTASVLQLYNAIHAAPLYSAATNSGVVTVAPWLWNRRETAQGRILVADDNRTNLMIVSRILEQAGFEVDTANSGTTALEKMCLQRYRVAILDMHMPGLDGTAVLRRFHLLRPRSQLPVIVLTANVTLEAQQACAEAGADAYLAKPVTAANLLAEVDRLISESQLKTLPTALSVGDEPAETEEKLLDVGVLAELDRLYHNPRELAALVQEYGREGGLLLERIAGACSARNYAGFCDSVHSFKSNAANVGALKLVQVCRSAEATGIIDFRRDPAALLEKMRATFIETLTALNDLLRVAPTVATRDIEQSTQQ